MSGDQAWPPGLNRQPSQPQRHASAYDDDSASPDEPTPPAGHALAALRPQPPHLTSSGFNAPLAPRPTGALPAIPPARHATSSSFSPPISPTGGLPAQPYSAPGHAPARHPTGGFPAALTPPELSETTDPSFLPPSAPYVTGAYPALVHTPPHAGHYTSPGFAPPLGPTGSFPGAHSAGHYTSPGFVPPVGPTGSFGPVTGGFAPVTGQHAPLQGPTLPLVVVTPSVRLTYAIWGGAIGALVGVALGLLNAILEGTRLVNAQGPIYGIAIVSMLIGAGCCAYTPNTFAQLARRAGFEHDAD